MVELGVAGDVAGDDFGGRRSSGEVELDARGHGEARGVMLRVPAGAVSALDMVVWPVGGRSHVGDELGGGACGAACCGRGRGRQQEREEGEGAQAHGKDDELGGAVGDELLRW